MTDLKNKVFLLTGAASGIGKALALALDKLGVRLILNDVNAQALVQVAKELQQTPLCLAFSVDTKAAWQQSLIDIDKHFAAIASKEQPYNGIDGIINNAGIAHDSVALEDMDEADFKKVMDINFYGVLFGTQTFLPTLKSKPQAWVVNVSSIFGITSIAQLGAYCASKFAVRGLTESLRMEAQDGFPNVTVCVVHPGGVQTPIANHAITVDQRDEQVREAEVKQFNRQLMTSPDKAANIIIQGIAKHRSKILIGPDAKLMDWLARWLPVKYTGIILSQLRKRGLLRD